MSCLLWDTALGEVTPNFIESLLQQKWSQENLYQAMTTGGMSGSGKENVVSAWERMKEMLEEMVF